MERGNGRELLNAYVFKTLCEVREKAEEWMVDCNYHQPHQALNFKNPGDLSEQL
ncbi:integrase core domain-containing protein [Mucilaginibacter sp.]|uniref:integrase core domain-containing protein n=1 Tax=Mucilaginibacter sp. TaxID=1882438 RepID=UPI003B006B76